MAKTPPHLAEHTGQQKKAIPTKKKLKIKLLIVFLDTFRDDLFAKPPPPIRGHNAWGHAGTPHPSGISLPWRA